MFPKDRAEPMALNSLDPIWPCYMHWSHLNDEMCCYIFEYDYNMWLEVNNFVYKNL